MTLNRNLASIALALLCLIVLAACCGMLLNAYPNGMGGDSGYPLGQYAAP